MVEIVRKVRPPPEEESEPSERPGLRTPTPPPQSQAPDIRMIDPATGQPVTSELDQIDLPPAGDYLGAIYELLVWASASLVALAKSTPTLVRLNPELERTIDQVATIGYQVTNTGAQVARGLWNWPFARVLINQQVERLIHPKEVEMFDRLYLEWYDLFIRPKEAGLKEPTKEDLVAWLKSKQDEIADPEGFLRLAINRYRMEQIAAKSAWTPTDMLALQRPSGGERRTTTTGLEKVFRRKPG